jgi:hypothetical protein
MSISPDFEVRIDDSGYVVFRHPYNDQKAFNFLKKNITASEIITVLTSEFGLNANSATNQHKDWLVNNYNGINKVVNEYLSICGIKVPNSVHEKLN